MISKSANSKKDPMLDKQIHRIKFYPVSNGDTSQFILANGKRLIFDFNHRKTGEAVDSPHIDLKAHLKKELDDAGKNTVEVFALTHADTDHLAGASDFFYLNHASKYQGEGRIKIETLWVPAVMLLEKYRRNESHPEYAPWAEEAWHRLLEGKGVRIFSKPKELATQLTEELKKIKLPANSRDHLFTHAGEFVPGFSLDTDGLELFTHSPFADHKEDGTTVERNEESLMFHVRFSADGKTTDMIQCGDSEAEALEWIVTKTQKEKKDERLCWDLFNIPHHCSYLALNINGQKGDKKTVPLPKVKELLDFGRPGAYIVSSSFSIPDNNKAYEQTQPPHIQARKTYEDALDEIGGTAFLVTMEESTEKKQEPIEFEISSRGLKRTKIATATDKISAAAIITSNSAPRAGSDTYD